MTKQKTETLSLEHEVLKILFDISRMVVSRSGIESEGYVLINKEMAIVPIHFGAILASINFPGKFVRTNQSDFNYYQNLNPTDKEIDKHGLSKYSVSLISDVIDNLAFEKDVIDKLENTSEFNHKRTIQLTEKGKIAYTTSSWIKLKEKEELERESISASIRTSKLTRRNIRVGWILGIATFIAVITNLFITIRKTNQDTEKQSSEALKQSQSKKDTLQLIQELHQISLSLKDTAKVKVKIEK
jgi:hypothetical protein